MSKQDRQGVRTAADIERKYDLGAIGDQRNDLSAQNQKISQLNQALSQYAAATNATIKELESKINEMEPGYEIGVGLKMKDSVLSVDSAQDFNGDNTRPVEAAFVQTMIGNVEYILQTI